MTPFIWGSAQATSVAATSVAPISSVIQDVRLRLRDIIQFVGTVIMPGVESVATRIRAKLGARIEARSIPLNVPRRKCDVASSDIRNGDSIARTVNGLSYGTVGSANRTKRYARSFEIGNDSAIRFG